MIIDNIRNYIRGWYIGDFDKTLHKTKDFEICVKYYKAGDYEPKHVHKLAKEITVIISGEVEMNGKRYYENCIVVMLPSEVTDFKAITDAINVVVKIPSVVGDKYVIN